MTIKWRLHSNYSNRTKSCNQIDRRARKNASLGKNPFCASSNTVPHSRPYFNNSKHAWKFQSAGNFFMNWEKQNSEFQNHSNHRFFEGKMDHRGYKNCKPNEQKLCNSIVASWCDSIKPSFFFRQARNWIKDDSDVNL